MMKTTSKEVNWDATFRDKLLTITCPDRGVSVSYLWDEESEIWSMESEEGWIDDDKLSLDERMSIWSHLFLSSGRLGLMGLDLTTIRTKLSDRDYEELTHYVASMALANELLQS